jgi:hypothetical protein
MLLPDKMLVPSFSRKFSMLFRKILNQHQIIQIVLLIYLHIRIYYNEHLILLLEFLIKIYSHLMLFNASIDKNIHMLYKHKIKALKNHLMYDYFKFPKSLTLNPKIYVS